MGKLSRALLGLRQSQVVPADNPNQTYAEKIMKYIPVDILAAWTSLTGILSQTTGSLPVWFNWAVFGAMLCLTPFYVCYLKTSPTGFSRVKVFHICIACLAFVTWVLATGTIPFSELSWMKPIYGSVLLILVTLLIPVLERFFNGPPVNPPPPASGGTVTPPGGSSSP